MNDDNELDCTVFDLLCAGIGVEAVAKRLGVKPPIVAAIAAKYREAIKRDGGLRAASQRRSSLTATAFGDPPIGRSALEKRALA